MVQPKRFPPYQPNPALPAAVTCTRTSPGCGSSQLVSVREAADLARDGTAASAGISVGSATLYDRTGLVGTCVVTTLSNARRQIDFSTNPPA
ncbi:hypothetical protein [Nocardia donostiensis]|uniref:Uncharacterized protein n=1 Tax=Nocardia donostiensis TaxID=1538463 RepID=A0A1V2TCQ5_9NOCA|nr:hypothetical protein B0T46_18710 [Nocardia donostiensis]OQS16604.1 hypothetical protein B0T36_02660 [Nocardia donostiensis]OQS21081.1 hypothetical protein B0T44_08640 [Nocardia donostiensis]